MLKLITIKFSHFNEKARWALDRFGVPYVEDGYMPGMHPVGVLPLVPKFGVGTSSKISTPLATPILLTDDGHCVRDSSRIVRYVSDRYAPPGQGLYPDPEVSELEIRFSDRLGPHTRRFAYFQAFQAPGLLDLMAKENVSPRQARWFKWLYPLISRFIAKRLSVNEESAARSEKVVREEFDLVSKRIESRAYLVGDRFTAADLAFAAMTAPALLPSRDEGYGAFLPPLDACPPAVRHLVQELRATPAGEFALRMFREERSASILRHRGINSAALDRSASRA